MTSVVLPAPDYLIRNTNLINAIAELRSDPKFVEGVELGMQARLEGRVKPWSQVKEELDIR